MTVFEEKGVAVPVIEFFMVPFKNVLFSKLPAYVQSLAVN